MIIQKESHLRLFFNVFDNDFKLYQKNKRFILKTLNENFKFSRYESSFLWLKNEQGELDFVIEDQGHVLPIEIKSGKDYQSLSAINKVLSNAQYDIPQAAVFSNKTPAQKGKIVYYPIYMLMFQKKQSELAEMIYRPDFSALM